VIDVIRTAADAIEGTTAAEHESAVGRALAFRAWESRIDLVRTAPWR
jgi:hypothetical protein